jgi:hypothetical protein
MKNNKLLLLVLSMVLLSLWLAACDSAKQATSPIKEAIFPAGKFLKSGEPNHALVFQKDGIFLVMEGSTTLVTGTYHVDGNTYTEESNNAGCSVPLSFKYTFDGKNLTFNYVGDPAQDTCGGGGRRADFDNVTYTLSK